MMNRVTTIQQLKRVPKKVWNVACGFALLVGSLVIVSLAVSNVVAHQGYETVAFAKPAAVIRTIRQADVNQFGSRVSNAFGIEHTVATEFADWILEASERQGIAPELLASLVITESSFRKNARSHGEQDDHDQQLVQQRQAFCGAKDLTDPEQNIYCGAQILSHLLERCDGDQDCALGAYNIGPYSQREGAAKRYVAKIDRYLLTLEEADERETSL